MDVKEWAILADDLTGALDTGVQLAKRGASVYVRTFGASDDESNNYLTVLATDTASRHDTPAAAYQKVYEAALHLKKQSFKGFYKKTDSALRGNFPGEIAAFAKAIGKPVCFIPFYPAQNRSTRDGCQYIEELPVELSSFAHDPRNPVKSGNIPALLESWALTAAVVAPPYILPTILPDVLVFDGKSEDDLKAIAKRLADDGERYAYAGCAGFAAHIPLKAIRQNRPVPIPQPLIALSGSLHPVTREQVERARAAGFSILTTDDIPFNPQSGELPEQALAKAAAQKLDSSFTGTLLVVGGDTLAAVLAALNLDGVMPLREIAPGVPLCRAGHLTLITKSGGFGQPDLLVKIMRSEEGLL